MCGAQRMNKQAMQVRAWIACSTSLQRAGAQGRLAGGTLADIPDTQGMVLQPTLNLMMRARGTAGPAAALLLIADAQLQAANRSTCCSRLSARPAVPYKRFRISWWPRTTNSLAALAAPT